MGRQVEDLRPLTSLRFVAAMMIVALHAKLYFSWSWLGNSPSFVQGVSFFFVLSGFILSHVYTSKTFPGYGLFLFSRFSRLWPVHVFSLIVLAICVTAGSVTFDGPGFFSKWVALAFNISLMHSAVPSVAYIFSWNAVSWSISTEIFFYLAFPFILININKTWLVKLLASLLVAGITATVLRNSGLPFGAPDTNAVTQIPVFYASPLIRGVEFCFGMSSWAVWDRYIRHRQMPFLAWTAIEITAVALAGIWLILAFPRVLKMIDDPAGQLVFGIMGSCWLFPVLIVALASGRGLLGRALSLRAPVFLGKISFSLYMIHQIVMKVVASPGRWQDIPSALLLLALISIAALMYLLVETPARSFLVRLALRRYQARAGEKRIFSAEF